MDVDGSFALSVGVVALYGVQNLPSADHLPRVLGWIDKNTKLGGRDVKNLTSSADMASAPISRPRILSASSRRAVSIKMGWRKRICLL